MHHPCLWFACTVAQVMSKQRLPPTPRCDARIKKSAKCVAGVSTSTTLSFHALKVLDAALIFSKARNCKTTLSINKSRSPLKPRFPRNRRNFACSSGAAENKKCVDALLKSPNAITATRCSDGVPRGCKGSHFLDQSIASVKTTICLAATKYLWVDAAILSIVLTISWTEP